VLLSELGGGVIAPTAPLATRLALSKGYFHKTRKRWDEATFDSLTSLPYSRRRAGLKPMQLHWSPRLWGPSPWWLDRLFIFVQTKETVMLSCTFRLTPIICRLFYIHIFILLKHIHQRVIVRLTEQDDVLAPLLGWAPRLGLVLGPALAKAGRRSCRGVCRSDHNFPKTKFVSKALMIQ